MTSSLVDAVSAARGALSAQMLSDTCQIRATVDTADGQGGYSQSWPNVTVTLPCMVASPPSSGAGQGGMIDVLAAQPGKTILVPPDTTVSPSFRITPASTGTTYEISHVEPPGSHEAFVTLQCIET